MNIPISRTELHDDDIKIIEQPLKSGWVVQGNFVKEFEDQFSEFTGAKHSIAVTSCTTALHLSLVALGFKEGDEAIVPAFTWISTANVVEHLGGKVIFCDIDLKTFNIDVNQIESKITPKTKAILPVHLFGLPSEMDKINEIAEKNNLIVVEDAACGFGSLYKNVHVGNFGNTGCFSFHPRKAITTGEGGMITTNDDSLALKLRSMRDHGAELSDFQRHHGSKPYLLSEYPYAGYNYRLTDIQASIATTQMKRAVSIVEERKNIALKYNESLTNLKFFQLPYYDDILNHSYQSYPCIYENNNLSIDNVKTINEKRNDFMDRLQNSGVSTRPATHAVHMLEYYSKKYEIRPHDFPNSYMANDCSISFPLFNGLKKAEQDYVVQKIHESLNK
tara:strand:- start:7488 stop:8657 length:1170 start_codon:yes stop_codon:yes gene_type:complete